MKAKIKTGILILLSTLGVFAMAVLTAFFMVGKWIEWDNEKLQKERYK